MVGYKYCSYQVNFPDSTLIVYGSCADVGDKLIFRIHLEYEGKTIVYKRWQRKKLGPVDLDDLPDSDPRVKKVAETFRKMGEEIFGTRFKTLLIRRHL